MSVSTPTLLIIEKVFLNGIKKGLSFVNGTTSGSSTLKRGDKVLLVPDQAHYLASSSFIEFQTVELEHVSSSTFARVFLVLARVIRIFQVFFRLSVVDSKF